MKKRWIALCLIFALVLTCFYGEVFASESKIEDNTNEMIGGVVVCSYLVHIADGVQVEQLGIPETVMPNWVALDSGEQGSFALLGCIVNSYEEESFLQALSETMTIEHGVLGYTVYGKHSEMGDVNADGVLGAEDALVCLQMVVEKYQAKTADEYMRALVGEKDSWEIPSKPDASCALHILQMVVGKY